MSKEIEKRWLNFIKSKTKSSAWKFKAFFIFKIEDQFLFDSMFFINGKRNSLTAVLHFKFAEIDDLLWKLSVENDNIQNHPLSVRINGAHMVTPISYYNFTLTDIMRTTLPNF